MGEMTEAMKRSFFAVLSVLITGLLVSLAAPDVMGMKLKILGNLSLLDIWVEVVIVVDVFSIAYILYTIFMNVRIGGKK